MTKDKGLRYVHYKDGEWTFVFWGGAKLPTRSQAMAEYMANQHDLPRNKYGIRPIITENPGGDYIVC